MEARNDASDATGAAARKRASSAAGSQSPPVDSTLPDAEDVVAEDAPEPEPEEPVETVEVVEAEELAEVPEPPTALEPELLPTGHTTAPPPARVSLQTLQLALDHRQRGTGVDALQAALGLPATGDVSDDLVAALPGGISREYLEGLGLEVVE